ncbi:hypothetical protein [Marinomonas ostreistagni]|uniref:STAS domain-containing protein n=1 Tax=Marinomonas ostreistagni TaxID=359209 RepID=A0ABS0Z7H5_9GAMM|nr:hypothetical protein [Marinomonas ostreistagni]MBJ7549549.1 hypothetical protein [Marinomonas ostreistagni]
MQIQTSDSLWSLSGHYDAKQLLKIKKSLIGRERVAEVLLDIAELSTMNAPIIALLIEIRRTSSSLVLRGCRAEFKELLKLYGVQGIFKFE